MYLVDDVPELRELIKYGMEEDPAFEVVGEAGDGRSALEGIAATRPAAVLLDLSMPDMDGFQAILEIRKRRPGRRDHRPLGFLGRPHGRADARARR